MQFQRSLVQTVEQTLDYIQLSGSGENIALCAASASQATLRPLQIFDGYGPRVKVERYWREHSLSTLIGTFEK